MKSKVILLIYGSGGHKAQMVRLLEKINMEYKEERVDFIGITESEVFFVTWSRFETQSYAGKVMYRIADRFYIQNKSLLKFYPKAIYSGLL